MTATNVLALLVIVFGLAIGALLIVLAASKDRYDALKEGMERRIKLFRSELDAKNAELEGMEDIDIAEDVPERWITDRPLILDTLRLMDRLLDRGLDPATALRAAHDMLKDKP